MKVKKELPQWSVEFRTYCTRNQLTIDDVSKKTGISKTAICNYRMGTKRPTLDSCNKIKKNIGFDMYEALYMAYKEDTKDE